MIRTLLGLTSVGLAMALAGCASMPGAGAGGSAAGVTVPAQASRTDAASLGAELLAIEVLPLGARRADASDTHLLPAPLTEDGCSTEEGHTLWRVPGSLDSVASFLKSHPAAGLRLIGFGTGGDPSGETNVEVTQSVPTTAVHGGSALVYSAVQSGGSDLVLRVDAEVVIAHETCVGFGGPMIRASR